MPNMTVRRASQALDLQFSVRRYGPAFAGRVVRTAVISSIAKSAYFLSAQSRVLFTVLSFCHPLRERKAGLAYVLSIIGVPAGQFDEMAEKN